MRGRILYAVLSAATVAVMAGRLAATDRPALGEAACSVAFGVLVLGTCLVVLAAVLAIPVLLLLAVRAVVWPSPTPVPAAPGDARKGF